MILYCIDISRLDVFTYNRYFVLVISYIRLDSNTHI
jgi:hypothetical protein